MKTEPTSAGVGAHLGTRTVRVHVQYSTYLADKADICALHLLQP